MILGLVCLSALVGCKHDEQLRVDSSYDAPISPADITYNALARRYNKTIQSMDTLWARTDIDIEWYEIDEDGERNYRSESGDGKFIMRRPLDTMLTVEKLGKIYLWAGSNQSHYWLFDLVDSDDKTLYVGAFEKINLPGRRAFPLPVRPDRVPILLGLMPLPPAEILGEAPPIDLFDGQYLVQIPGLRMLIDPATNRPTRVDLTDQAGFSVLTSKLTGTFKVDGRVAEDDVRPTMCEKAEIYVSGIESRLTVQIDSATTDKSKVRDQTFDLIGLTKSRTLEPRSVIMLDPQPQPQPQPQPHPER